MKPTPEQISVIVTRHASAKLIDPRAILSPNESRSYAIARCRGEIGRELRQAYRMSYSVIAKLFRQSWTTTYEQITQKQQAKRRSYRKHAILNE